MIKPECIIPILGCHGLLKYELQFFGLCSYLHNYTLYCIFIHFLYLPEKKLRHTYECIPLTNHLHIVNLPIF